MSNSHEQIPHALATSRRELFAVLDKEIKKFNASPQYSIPLDVYNDVKRYVERFVVALSEIAGGLDELRSRATLVETLCGPGTDFFTACTKRSLQKLSRLEFRRPLECVKGRLSNVQQIIEDIDKNLEEGRFDSLRKAFERLRSTCWGVQRRAGPLNVDGCQNLFLIHQASEEGPSERAKRAKTISKGDVESIKAAVESLIAWAAETSTDNALTFVRRQAREQPEPANPPGGQNQAESLVGLLGGKDLRDALGVHPTRADAFMRQLTRIREKMGDDWLEVNNPRSNSPKFLHRIEAVRDLAERYKSPKPS